MINAGLAQARPKSLVVNMATEVLLRGILLNAAIGVVIPVLEHVVIVIWRMALTHFRKLVWKKWQTMSFVDGKSIASHTGRRYPVTLVSMSVCFFAYCTVKFKKLVTDCTNEIERAFTRQWNQQRPVGLAIVIGTIDSPPLGTDKDVENMKGAFERLQFAVVKKEVAHLDDLRAIVKVAAEYPYIAQVPSCKVIALYYAGHGNSKGGRPLVVIRDGEEHFVDDIVSPFYPMNAPKLKNIKRLFFFDMCLGEQVDAGIRKLVKAKPLQKHAIPAKGNCLVAYANSVGFESHDTTDGGFWTRHLYKNITKDMEIHQVLAKTHDDTVNDPDLQQRVQNKNIQGPFWTTCMGYLNLKRKLC